MNVVCEPCQAPMSLLFQAKDDQGIDTFTFICPTCSGKVGVQDEASQPSAAGPPTQPKSLHELALQIETQSGLGLEELHSQIQPHAV